MTNHTGHNHPMTPTGRAWCRKLRLGDRPGTVLDQGDRVISGNTIYHITATDVQGRWLDLNGTAEGESFMTESLSYVVWVLENLRYGVDHDWDAETHTIRKVARISIRYVQRCSWTPSGWSYGSAAEVHTIHADGTRTYEMKTEH